MCIECVLVTAEITSKKHHSLSPLPPSPSLRPGELMTTAGWIRKQVVSHPDYRQDSVVSDRMTLDLMQLMKGVTEGSIPCPNLLGTLSSKAPKTYTVLESVECPSTSNLNE